MTSSIDIHEMSTSFRIELLKLSNAAFFILTSSNETDASDSSSTTSRNSYIVGAVVGGILGVLILFGLASIAHFRYVILPQSQKERETRISDTWDDSFRPSLIISSWVSRVVSTRLSISRQPIKSEMDSYSSDYPINDNGDNTIGRPSIDPDADSVFHSSTDPVLRTSPKHDSSRLSIQESIRENLRESGQSSRDSNISKNDRHNPNQPNSLSSGLSVLRTSPLGRSPVVLARSMDSSRRRANTGGSSSSSSSPVEDRNTRGIRWRATQLVAITGHRVRLLPTLDSPQIDILLPTQSPVFTVTRALEGSIWGHLEYAFLSTRGQQYPGLEPSKHAWCLLQSSTGSVFWEELNIGINGDRMSIGSAYVRA